MMVVHPFQMILLVSFLEIFLLAIISQIANLSDTSNNKGFYIKLLFFINLESDPSIFHLCIVGLFLSILVGILKLLSQILSGFITKKIVENISAKIFKILFSQSYDFHFAYGASKKIAAFEKSQLLMSNILNPLFSLIIAIFISLMIIFFLFLNISLIHFIFIFIIIFFYLIVGFFLKIKLKSNSEIINNNQTIRVQMINNVIRNIRDVIMNNNLEFYLDSFKKNESLMRLKQVLNNIYISIPRNIIETTFYVTLRDEAFSCSLERNADAVRS